MRAAAMELPMPHPIRHRLRQTQRGVTVVVVLVILSVMLLGGLALARMTETGSLVFGNVAAKDASVLASEAAVNEAFNRISALNFDQTNDQAGWYRAQMQATDGNGLPTLNFDQGALVGIGTILGSEKPRYEARYVVERMCNTAAVSDIIQQCLVRMKEAKTQAIDADRAQIAPENMKQFRITVRVTDQRGTTTWVQSLATVRDTVGAGS